MSYGSTGSSSYTSTNKTHRQVGFLSSPYMLLRVLRRASLNFSDSCWAKPSIDLGDFSSSIAACKIITISEFNERPFFDALMVRSRLRLSGILTLYGAMSLTFVFIVAIHAFQLLNIMLKIYQS